MAQDSELDSILAERRLTPIFQPIVRCHSHTVYGYEALIRGPSDSAMHAPVTLFDAAQRCGRLRELDLMCRERAIEAFARLKLPGQLFLNVTPDNVLEADFRDGATAEALERAGLAPASVVIELTEQVPIDDYAVMRAAVAHYREAGFSIAIDDLGAGYAGLRHWSELAPDFVKIDRHFATNVDQDQKKREFIRSMLDMARNLGCQVICEGIETLEEYRTLWSMGLELGQGYFFARPTGQPARFVDTALPTSSGDATDPQRRVGFGQSVSVLRREVAPVAPETPAEAVTARFQEDPQLRSLAVVGHDGRPAGMIRRGELLNRFAGHYGRALFARRPIIELAQPNPVTAAHDAPLEEVSRLITESPELTGEEDFIILDGDGCYAGIGTVIDLLRSITELQIRNARYANPLTGLPGNVPINEQLAALLDQEVPFTLAYIDLDEFKAFNDTYGYSRGDDVIAALARVLEDHAERQLDFVGHVGGDDFVVIFRSSDWKARCEAILEQFAELAPWFYGAEHRRAGGLWCSDRQGRQSFHAIVTLSIGAVPVQDHAFSSRHEIAVAASEVKAQAKRITGNSLFQDRRAASEATDTRRGMAPAAEHARGMKSSA